MTEHSHIEIDLHLRDAASVFARGKQDTCAGPQRESSRRRLLQFVAEYDQLAGEAVPRFVVGPQQRVDETEER